MIELLERVYNNENLEDISEYRNDEIDELIDYSYWLLGKSLKAREKRKESDQ